MLTGKVAIVTGGTKGLGNGIAQALLNKGAHVAITSRNLTAATQTATQLNKYSINPAQMSAGFSFNLEHSEDISPLIENVIEKFGKIDILINNAISMNCLGPLEALSDEQIVAAFTANITNTLLLTRAAHPYLRTTQGSIVNIGSVVTNQHLLGLPLYTIIKAGISQMTKVLAAEWAADHIRVNGINPGFVRSDAFADMGMSADLIEKNYSFYKDYCPIGRVGNPNDIGELLSYLVSDNASFITGTSIEIDGGYSIRGLPLYSADE